MLQGLLSLAMISSLLAATIVKRRSTEKKGNSGLLYEKLVGTAPVKIGHV